MSKRIISTNKAPRSGAGLYHQAVAQNNTVYVSGQLGIDISKDSKKIVEGGIEAETKQVFKNIGAILNAAGASLKDILQCTVFVVDSSNNKIFNQVYKEFAHGELDPVPSRVFANVSELPLGALVEISCVADIPQ